MKGTAPRGRTTAEDRQIAEWLRNDPKNRSENVMIVDLLRNDLGRLCNYGSVRVEDLFAVERYPSLWQMTSTVTGDAAPRYRLSKRSSARCFPAVPSPARPRCTPWNCWRKLKTNPEASTPAPSDSSRAPATVFNVAIRTLECASEQNATMGVGSGIVIDSNPGDEFRECQLKAEFLTRQREPFSLIETLLWQGAYPLIELHLDRLADSASLLRIRLRPGCKSRPPC